MSEKSKRLETTISEYAKNTILTGIILIDDQPARIMNAKHGYSNQYSVQYKQFGMVRITSMGGDAPVILTEWNESIKAGRGELELDDLE